MTLEEVPQRQHRHQGRVATPPKPPPKSSKPRKVKKKKKKTTTTTNEKKTADKIKARQRRQREQNEQYEQYEQQEEKPQQRQSHRQRMMPEELAPNWQAVLDPNGSGHHYYYNSQTQATTWHKPVA